MVKGKLHVVILMAVFLFRVLLVSGQAKNTVANPSDYLGDIKTGLKKEWPNNRTINLVFHGHSVPAGYFNTPNVRTLESYPNQVLKQLKELYPYAVINIINTAIGGENSVSGAKRFKQEVLVHKPDVLFIDYSLNDRAVGLEKSKDAWSAMIEKARKRGIKVILLTPSPDQQENIQDPDALLEKHSKQVRELSGKYNIGLVDTYALFKQLATSGDTLSSYMSQSNHPNGKGHLLIAGEIMKFFK